MMIRHRTDVQKFGPKQADDPNVGQPCPKCRVAFKAGDFVALRQLKRNDVSPSVAVIAAEEWHWSCVVAADDALVTAVAVDTRESGDWVEVYSEGERSGTIVVRKGLGDKIAERLLCDPPPPKSAEKPSTPPPPLGDWRAHFRYAVAYVPTSAPPVPAELIRETLRRADSLPIDQAERVMAEMCSSGGLVLTRCLRVAAASAEPMNELQRATVEDSREIVRRASVAYLAILAERSRQFS